MKYLALALVVIAALAIFAFYPRRLATDTVSPYQLREAAELAKKYPDSAASFASKIASNKLTRGEFELLELAVEPAIDAEEAKQAEARKTRIQQTDHFSYWLEYQDGFYWILTPIGVLACLVLLGAAFRQVWIP